MADPDTTPGTGPIDRSVLLDVVMAGSISDVVDGVVDGVIVEVRPGRATVTDQDGVWPLPPLA